MVKSILRVLGYPVESERLARMQLRKVDTIAALMHHLSPHLAVIDELGAECQSRYLMITNVLADSFPGREVPRELIKRVRLLWKVCELVRGVSDNITEGTFVRAALEDLARQGEAGVLGSLGEDVRKRDIDE